MTLLNFTTDEQVYTNAFAKALTGENLTNAEKMIFLEKNEQLKGNFTHDTSNTQILIPETVVDGIFKRAEEAYPFFANTEKYAVRGKLSFTKREDNASDGTWTSENTETASDELLFGSLELSGHQLAKSVTVSWLLRDMSAQNFIEYLQNELEERISVVLSHTVVNGTGNGQPTGVITALKAQVGTPQIVTYDEATGLQYTDVLKALGKLHTSYSATTQIYVHPATLWAQLANIVDNIGKPIFINELEHEIVNKMFGFTVNPDGSIPVGKVLIGDAKAYKVNINREFKLVVQDQAKQLKTDYVAYGIFDGGVLDEKAFVLIEPAIVTP